MPGITRTKLVKVLPSPKMIFVRWFLVFFCMSGLNVLSAQYSIQSSGNYAPQVQNPVDVTINPDDITVPLDIGFDFTFFENTYTQFSISSNGFISFQNGGGSGTVLQTIPDPDDPNDLIALGWSSLMPDYAQFSYETLGTAPYRTLHINFYIWDSFEPPGCPSGFYLDGQIILYETTNIIEIHTQNWSGGDCGISATQGIENEDGTVAFSLPGRNNDLWMVSNSLVRFIPDSYLDLEVSSMDPVMCDGLRDIRMLVQNVGGVTIDTFYADWTWDGVPQDAVNVYASLPPNSATEVVLGQKTLVPGSNYLLKAWSYDPENQPDHFTPNDTISGTVRTGLAGTFTVGGVSPDYTTISGAIADLVFSGACDTVVFNIRNGTYTEELDIPYVTIATGAVVIFKSETNNPANVIITRNYTTGSNNRMIEITNASHLRFNDLTLKVTGTVCSSVVYMNSYCADIQFTGCNILGSTCNSTSTSGAVIALVNGQMDDIHFESNVIRKGSYGLYVSPGFSSFANDLVLEENSIDSAYRYGAFLNRIQGMNVIGNTIFSPTTSSNGIETNTTYGPTRIERNSIYMPQGTYGLRVYRYNYLAPSAPDTTFVLNNMINLAGTVSGSRSFSVEQSNKVNVWHNTFHTTSANTSSYSVYSTGNTLTDLRNSIITNFGTGRAAWMNTITSDHNVFFNLTPPLIGNVTDYAILEDWVQASGQDSNSIGIDPEFVSSTDLHVSQGALNNAGDALLPPVMDDFDGENRNLSTPDIGADEFGFLNDDMITSDILFSNQLVTGENELKAVVYNIGLNPVNTYALAWKINNTIYTPVMVSTPIPVGGGDTIVLGTVDFDPNVSYTIKVNTQLPNGNPDSDPSNDTLTIGPIYAKLSGTYTVGGVSPDFPTLSGAFAAVAAGGILDSVAFAVRDGIYNDPLDLTTNTNYACTKPISVYSESLDASDVIFNNNNLVKPVIRLNGVHGIHFSHMTFELTSSAFHNVVIIENGASCNRFSSCIFTGRISTQTSTAYATVLCNSNQGVDNDFYDNLFQLGAYGLVTNGPNLSSGSLVDVVGNTFLNNYQQGGSFSNSPQINIIGNYATITSAQHASYSGMFANNCKRMELSYNKVFNPFTSGGGALGFSECDGTMQDTTRVFNNFVYAGTSNNLASILGGGYSDYTHVSNNTSRSFQGRASGYSWCSNFRADNNIFECIGAGVSLELLNMQGSDIVSNNNCLYAPLGSIGEHNNTIYDTMAQWQALGFDVNSYNENPLCVDTSFHVHSAKLDGLGIHYAHITDDFEGDPRHLTTPDIGADEYDPLTADAGILALVNPKMPFPAGTNPLYVRFYNNSGDTMNSVLLSWEVNGITQTPFLWTGILAKGAIYDSLEIGNFNFAAETPYDIKIWVSLPNGLPDQLSINDTIEIVNQYAGLSGMYTIGGDAPDFETIGEAVLALNNGGASAPVTFNIRSGTYLETIIINDFAGSDCDRPVIFQSESGDSSLVTITNLGINAHTIVLNGADGVHFKNMTLKSVNTAFRHVVLFSGGAHCNQFEGNTFKGFQSTATANTSAVIRSTAGLDTANVIINNRIMDGSYSIHLTGNGGGITHTVITGNHLEPYFTGIYNSVLQGVTISHNTIIADNHTSGQGLEILTGHNLIEISYNKIMVPLGQYGILLDNCDNTTNNRGRIYNNFVTVGGTSVARGIYLNGCAFQDILHNNILVYSTNTTLANTAPLYINNSPDIRIRNNATRNAGPGYAIYANGNTTFVANRNSYHTAGTTFGFWNGGAAETTFTNWQTASGQDANSLNVNPAFMSNTDLHTFLVLLNEAGDPTTGILDDIDGQGRDPLPDIGADEFDPLPSNDAGIFMFAGPHIPFAAGNKPVNLVIKNFGGNALTSATVKWTVNGIEQTPFNWTGNLPSAICDTFQVGNYVFDELIAYTIDAWTEMPNGVPDATPDNDLFSTGVFYASLAGTYTVGGFAPDFNLVSDLETILNAAGIVNNVTFQFRPGEYVEALSITDFPRIAYAHTVTFTSESGDSTDVILTQNANNTVLVDLDDAHRITFSHLSLTNTKSHIFQIRNGSSQISISNSSLEGPTALSSSRYLIYSPTTTEDSLSILNNRLHNGYYGIYLYGGDYEKRHIITGNTFTGNFQYCVYLRKFDGLNFSNNTLNAAYTGNMDIYMYTGSGACTFKRNRIFSDNSNYAWYLGTITNTSPNSTLFENNFIYKAGTGSSAAVVIENVAKINIDFNSIHNATNHLNSVALYTNNLSTHNIRNNIVYSIAGPAFQNIGTLPAVHNYNAIYSLGPVEAMQNTTTYASLAAYASATGTNANSKAFDPLFINTAGPEISQFQLNGTGLTIAGITTDINGATRTSPPDVGADEFTPPAFDVKMARIAAPVEGCGLSDEEIVQVALVNMGSAVASGFEVYFDFAGEVVAENIGSLQVPPGDTLFYTFTETIDPSMFGTHILSTWIDFPSDVYPSNDSASYTFTNYPPLNIPPGNLIPANGTTGLENQVSLSWSPVTNAASYKLFIWPSTGSKPVTPTYSGLTTINKLATGLSYGTTYLWQVHAVNICNEELASDTSTFSVRFLPDLVIQSMTIPSTGFSEQTIGIEWITKNQGPGLTIPGTWYENIYLSADPTYNSFDPLLASVPNLNSLNPNQTYAHSANVVLPQGSNGLYYIIIKTDHYNGVKETVDNNNTTYSATQINVTLSPPPDLITININTPTVTFSGQSITISYEVKNIGSGITTDNIWKDDITLVPAPGNSNGATQSYGSRTHTGLLLPDSSYQVLHTIDIPENIFGDHQIHIFTDSKNDVFEFASEGNNQSLSGVFEIILTPPVDLVPDSLETPDTLSLYETYPLTYQVRNEGGSAPTEGWTDRYYLSQSPVYNTNFLTLLGSAYHNAGLLPDEANHKTVNVKLTENISGIYYIYLFTDYSNKINEYTLEGNNIIRSEPFTVIKPDIKPDSLIHVMNIMSGTTLSVRAELINPGQGVYKGNHQSRFYLSNDAILSTESDILLTTKTSSNIILSDSDTISFSANMLIPIQSFGSKYILCHADAPGSIFESNETNNVLASPITIFESPHPDLEPSGISAPDTIRAGVPFEIEYTLSNTGNVPMQVSVIDSIFLSFSPTWNRALATPIGYRGTSFLDTSAFVLQEVPLETAFSQNPNEYYIYILSDATAKVYEGSGEANNILRSDQLVLLSYPEIDLALHSITGVPDTLTSGQSLPVSYLVQNLSDDPTYFSTWNEKLYFSNDSVFNPMVDMPVHVFAYTEGVVDANSDVEALAILEIPDGITGDYYFFIETDYEDSNDDANRSNNINTVRIVGVAQKIHIKLALYPDLAPTDFVTPVEITSGQYFTISTQVTNIGAGPSNPRTDKIFVSTNNMIENGDLALATVVRPTLAAGSTQEETFSVFIPANYTGNYYLIYAIDYGNVVYEYNDENNNILLSSIIATPPPPADLIVQDILVPDSVLAGEMASITWQTENQGQNPANGQFREILYLSSDTLWQVEDEVLAVWDGSVALAAGATTTKTIEVPYNRITNGDYHTLIRTDARNNISESDEDNNEGYSYDKTNVDIEEIFLDVQSEKILPFNTYRYFKVAIPAEEANRNMLIELKGDSLLGVNELYVKYGSVPTEADHDFAYSTPFSSHQQIIARTITPGYYYIMVKGFMIEGSGPQTISLLARMIHMEIISMSPNRGGNTGYTTIEALGSELDSIIQVKLVLDDSTQYHEIVADTFLSLSDGGRILARFNLKGQPLGHYHLQCHRESIWMASYQRGFEIIQGGGSNLQVNWDINPKSYNPRFNSLFQIKIDVENRGDSDVEDRFVRVNTPDYDNPVYYSLNDYYNGIEHPQLVLASEDLNGFPGILRPGSRRTFYVFGSVGGTQGFSIYYDK